MISFLKVCQLVRGHTAVAAIFISATCASVADPCSIPDGWPLASAIQDLSSIPASSVPTAFGLNGWSRISEKLASVKPEELSGVKSNPLGFAQSLLTGSDTEKYCAQINALSQSGKIEIPLDLLEARDVASALHPFLPDLAEKLAAKPSVETIQAAIQALITQIARDDRLASKIDLVKEQISSGVLKLARPNNWTGAWPSDRSRLEALASLLRHQPAEALRICSPSEAVSVSVSVSAKQISEARQTAETLIEAAEEWAKSCASLSPLVERAPPEAEAAIVEYLVPVISRDPEKPQLFLGPIATDPTTYFAAVRARINNSHVRWPLGITINSVVVGADGRPSFQPIAMRPNIAPVDAEALVQTLRQLGLPAIVSLTDSSLQVDKNFQDMRIRARFAIGKHNFDREVVLIEKGLARDLQTLIRDLKKDLASDIAETIRTTPLPVSLNGNAIALAATIVEINDDLTTATVSGNLALNVLFGTSHGPIIVYATFAVPLDGGAVKLKDARWPDQILANLRTQLSSRLSVTVPSGAACVGIAGLSLSLSDQFELGLLASFAQDGHILDRVSIDTAQPFDAIAKRLLQLASEPSALQCIARQALGILAADEKAALESLRNASVTLLGLKFHVRDPALIAVNGKLGVKFDLALATDDTLLISDVKIENGWTPGNSISATSLSVEGVALPSATAKRLLAQINPRLTNWITLDKVAFGGGRLSLDGKLTIPGLATPVILRNLVLKLDAAVEEISATLRSAVLQAINSIAGNLAELLPSLGTITEMRVDESATRLDGPDLAVVLRVKVKVQTFKTMELPFLIELPSLKVKPDSAISADILDEALGSLLQAVGASRGDGIKNVKTFADDQKHRYGATFDASIMIASIIKVDARGFIVDQRGLSFPDSLKIEIPGVVPLAPLPLVISQFGGTIWLNPRGKFQASATAVPAGDMSGTAFRLDGAVTGDTRQRTLSVDGSLAVFTAPLFRTQGVMDFGRNSVIVDAQTLKPLASILNFKSKVSIEKTGLSADSKLDMLGLSTNGQLRILFDDSKRVSVTGHARWASLGSAEVTLRTTTAFRNPAADASIDLAIGAKAKAAIDLSHVVLGFRWSGIGVTVIAPNVASVTPELIERILRSLLDFKFDFKRLKDMNITISLLDSQGKTTNAAYGGGSTPGGNRGSALDASPPIQHPTSPGKSGSTEETGGDSVRVADSTDRCSLGASFADRKRVWITSGSLGTDQLIEADYSAGDHMNYVSTESRIMSGTAKTEYDKAVLVGCFHGTLSDRPKAPLQLTGGATIQIRNDDFAVFMRPEFPGRLFALEFFRGAGIVEIVFPEGASFAIFGSDGPRLEEKWKPSLHRRNLLSGLVENQLRDAARIDSMRAVDPRAIIPEWSPQEASLIFQTLKSGKKTVLLQRGIENIEIDGGTPFYQSLAESADGLFAQLAASATRFNSLNDPYRSQIRLRPSDGACRLALVDTGIERYAVAHTSSAHGVAHFANASTWDFANRGWLDPYCSSLVDAGPKAEVVIFSDTGGSDATVAGRTWAEEAGEARWWLSMAKKPGENAPAIVEKISSMKQNIMTKCFGPLGGFKWADQTDIERFLIALSGLNWKSQFTINPQQLFVAVAETGCVGSRE